MFWSLVVSAVFRCTGARADETRTDVHQVPCFSFDLNKNSANAYLAGQQTVSRALVQSGLDPRCLDDNGIYDPDLGDDDLDCGNL